MSRDEVLELLERQFVLGTIRPEERARLVAAVRDDDELRKLYDRYAEMEIGLADGNPGAMRQRILDGLRAAPAEASAPAPVDLTARRAGRRVWLIAGASLAAAALILFTLWSRPGGPGALPGYAVELSAGAQVLRDTPEPSARFEPSTVFSLTLRPDRSVQGALRAEAILVGEAVHVAKGAWRQAEGAFILQGRTDALFDAPPGRYELVVLVGRADAWPEDLVHAEEGPALRISRRWIDLVPAPAER